jgi:hypothetical protein
VGIFERYPVRSAIFGGSSIGAAVLITVVLGLTLAAYIAGWLSAGQSDFGIILAVAVLFETARRASRLSAEAESDADKSVRVPSSAQQPI